MLCTLYSLYFCFTGTKVQMLTLAEREAPTSVRSTAAAHAQFTGFTGTKVQILTHKSLQAPTSLRSSGAAQAVCGTMASGTRFTRFTYWYKSTDTDA